MSSPSLHETYHERPLEKEGLPSWQSGGSGNPYLFRFHAQLLPDPFPPL